MHIRPIKTEEIPLLRNFLYEAIYQRDENELLPRSIVEQPEIKVYIENFGGSDDYCLVAVDADTIVGAVWTRILSGLVKGFGNIDSQTPEFAISLLKEYRGRGIGTKLMLEMLRLMKEKGYSRVSLAVQKDNPAVSLYQKVGFSILDENNQEYIMMHTF